MRVKQNCADSVKQQQQQQQPVQQPEVQPQVQQYPSQQEYEDDYDSSGQRPSSRGSKQHMENGNSYATSSGHSGHGYTIQHSGSAGNQRRDEREDDEDEMW